MIDNFHMILALVVLVAGMATIVWALLMGRELHLFAAMVLAALLVGGTFLLLQRGTSPSLYEAPPAVTQEGAH
jgi:hypothetical protein